MLLSVLVNHLPGGWPKKIGYAPPKYYPVFMQIILFNRVPPPQMYPVPDSPQKRKPPGSPEHTLFLVNIVTCGQWPNQWMRGRVGELVESSPNGNSQHLQFSQHIMYISSVICLVKTTFDAMRLAPHYDNEYQRVELWMIGPMDSWSHGLLVPLGRQLVPLCRRLVPLVDYW